MQYDAHATLQLTEQLLSLASVTPQDAGCQALIAQRGARSAFGQMRGDLAGGGAIQLAVDMGVEHLL